MNTAWLDVPAYVLSCSHLLCLYSTLCSAKSLLLVLIQCSWRLRVQALNLCFKSCRKLYKRTQGVWILLKFKSRHLCTYTYSHNLFFMLLKFHDTSHRTLYLLNIIVFKYLCMTNEICGIMKYGKQWGKCLGFEVIHYTNTIMRQLNLI